MKKLFFYTLLIVSSAAILTSAKAQADITVDELRQTLLAQNLSQEETEQVVSTLQSNMPSAEGEGTLAIDGFLFAQGFNGAFFVDHDNWNFDVTFRSPRTNQLVTVPKLVVGDFHNGGIKFEIGYKWIFLFMPSGMNVKQLAGAEYGRGIGATVAVAFGIDIAWLPGDNRPLSLFLVAPKVGVGSGLSFPKIKFALRTRQK